MIATAQKAAEAPVDYPTVLVWNYDTLELLVTIGRTEGEEDEVAFSGDICCLAFSWPDADGNSVLAVVDGEENRILSIWDSRGFESTSSLIPNFFKLHDAVASEEEVLSAHFLPESANQLVLTGKGQVSLWSFQKDGGDGEEGGGLEKKQARRV